MNPEMINEATHQIEELIGMLLQTDHHKNVAH